MKQNNESFSSKESLKLLISYQSTENNETLSLCLGTTLISALCATQLSFKSVIFLLKRVKALHYEHKNKFRT